MASARLTTFLILIFILLTLRFSSAHQVKQRLRVATGSKLETARSSVNVEDVPAVVEAEKRIRFLPERKMMSKGVLSTTKEKAHCMIGKCKHEGGRRILNVVKNKFSKRSGRYGKVKMSGFVALNADYYVPRPHPPKNTD